MAADALFRDLIPEPPARDPDGPTVPAVVQFDGLGEFPLSDPAPQRHARRNRQNSQHTVCVNQRVGVVRKPGEGGPMRRRYAFRIGLGLCGHSVSANRMLLE